MHRNLSDAAHRPPADRGPGHTAPPPFSRRFFRRLLSVAAIALALWLSVGTLLHLSGWRDRSDGLSLVYYTTPWPVIAAGVAALGLRARLRRRNRIACIFGIAATAAGITWISTSWHSSSPLAGAADFRVVLWNVRNNPDDVAAMAARIREFSPDIVALAEAGVDRSNIAEWEAAFPEYVVERLPQQMLTMSRTRLQRGKSGVLAYGSFFGICTSQIIGREVTIVQADIDARPIRSRRAAFEVLTSYVHERAGQPLILLGDFNTPRHSWHIDSIRGMLSHAFEARGSGLADTWPIPFPVLSLDQVWVSPELEVVSCRQGWSLMSDHRPVCVELRFR